MWKDIVMLEHLLQWRCDHGVMCPQTLCHKWHEYLNLWSNALIFKTDLYVNLTIMYFRPCNTTGVRTYLVIHVSFANIINPVSSPCYSQTFLITCWDLYMFCAVIYRGTSWEHFNCSCTHWQVASLFDIHTVILYNSQLKTSRGSTLFVHP